MDDYETLSDEVVSGIKQALASDSAISTEIEVGSPSGIFIGVADLPDSDEISVYIYLADRRAHNEFDNHTQNSDEPFNSMFQESLQLNRISTELLSLLDMYVESISIDKDVFRNVKPDFNDDYEPEIGAYYGLKFPDSDVKVNSVE